MSCKRLAAIGLAALAVLGTAPAAAQTGRPQIQKPADPGAAVPAPLQPGDAFGERVTLPERTIVYVSGHSQWDKAFDTLVDAFRQLNAYLDKQGIKPSGPALTIYTQTDDDGFDFRAAMPITTKPKNPPKGDIALGEAPAGKALKFVHRGSFNAMDATYEAITNYLDDKQLEAKGAFIEEYTSDPTTAAEDRLVINILVPVN